jgi:hypothetical protein
MRRFATAGAAVVLLLLASAAVAAASGWTIEQTPNLTGGSDIILHDVSCASASVCTAVGDYYNGIARVTLAERWDGIKWSILHTPNPTGSTDSVLLGVSCVSAGACTAVGDYYNGTADVPLAERWNGTKWSIQHAPNPIANHGVLGMPGVSCVSASACVAVGGYFNGTAWVTLAERWDGIKWSILHTPNPTVTRGGTLGLEGVSCASASACTAVGNSFNGSAQVTLAERWNGTKWSTQHTPNPTDASDKTTLGGVSCASGSACTAVGDYVRGVPYVYVTLAERWTG